MKPTARASIAEQPPDEGARSRAHRAPRTETDARTAATMPQTHDGKKKPPTAATNLIGSCPPVSPPSRRARVF